MKTSPPALCQLWEFLFLTGCRISEAIGLRWGDIQRDSIKLWSPVVEGDRMESLKTGDLRFFPINSQLQSLTTRIGRGGDEDSVFLSEDGAIVNAGNFLKRHWKPALEGLNIRYRKAQNTRHTFATLCLIKGISPALVAQWIGDSIATLMKYYAGFIPGQVPKLWINLSPPPRSLHSLLSSHFLHTFYILSTLSPRVTAY